MNTGEKIKEARLKKGLTQEELGALLGVKRSAIAKYECGRITNIKKATLIKLSNILDINLAELLLCESGDNSKKNVGARIKKRRKEMKMSGEELAAQIGVNRSTLFRYENGEIENIPLDALEPIAKALKVNVTYLLNLEPGQKNNDITEDIVYKMKNDEKFFMCVEMLRKLDNTQLQAVTQLLKAFL